MLFARIMVSPTLAQIVNADPSAAEEDHKRFRSQLDKLSGAEFDLAYIRGQVADHNKIERQTFEYAGRRFRACRRSGRPPALRR
jgi:predicted outer membrane protein